MNLITFLKKDFAHYVSCCLDGLKRNVDKVFIDHTRGETSCSFLFFIKKEELTFMDAIAILSVRLKMHQEEWNDISVYERADIERWIGFMAADYKGSTYKRNVNFEYKKETRLTGENYYIKAIFWNGQQIDIKALESINPLQSEKILRSDASVFKSIADEYYIETENHYILFYWYTTA